MDSRCPLNEFRDLTRPTNEKKESGERPKIIISYISFCFHSFRTAGMELVHALQCCVKKKNDEDDENDADANNNVWGNFILRPRHPDQIISRIRRMRYPRPASWDEDMLSFTAHAYDSLENDENDDENDDNRESSV